MCLRFPAVGLKYGLFLGQGLTVTSIKLFFLFFVMGTWQSSGRVKGVLKHAPSDFVVEEIDSQENVLRVDAKYSYAEGCGDFLHVVMKKRNVDTISAVFRLCSTLGVPERRVSYAGVKDKVAVSVQRISIYKMPVARVSGLRMKDIRLHPVGVGGKVYRGDLWGNRFTVCVRNVDLSCDEVEDYVNKRVREMGGVFPNFFGEQRFGSVRPVTCPVGLEILRGDVSQAVFEYICRVFPGEDEGVAEVRRIAASDKARALMMFSRSYVYERVMLEHLIAHEGDYYGAFMRLPLGLRRMFVSAVQSYVFNEVLRRMVRDGVCGDDMKIPIVGYLYEKRIVEGAADKYVERVLRKEKILPSMFKLRDFPELSSEGGYRNAFEKFCDFEVVSVDEDDVFFGRSKVVLRFSLPKGCYATVFLGEFFDCNNKVCQSTKA